MTNIRLPNPSGDGSEVNLELSPHRNLVIVGPNGSGKTRMAAWIEHRLPQDKSHRISAQRMLLIGDEVDPMNFEAASNLLIFGQNTRSHKDRGRWNGDPVINVPNDFRVVLSLLFAQYNKVSRSYAEQARLSGRPPLSLPPDAAVDVLSRIWEVVFPQRKIEFNFDANKVEAVVKSTNQHYQGKQMSDGEKVGLYLMAQCLCAPADCTLIVDEPEIHLHKAILARLWDELENARPDCAFVYITHDLEFAATRTNAQKIAIQEFFGPASWTWVEVPTVDDIPEDLVLKILGSRKPIIFVEGELNSLDYLIYRLFYKKALVIPRGSSDKVIEATKAFRTLEQFHRLNPVGIIDRDFKKDNEIAALATDGIFALEVAEVESLFITEEVVRAVASSSLHIDANQAFERAKSSLFELLQRQLPHQILEHTRKRVRDAVLTQLGSRCVNSNELGHRVTELSNSVSVADIAREMEDDFNDVIQRRDYKAALRRFNNKGLIGHISNAIQPSLGKEAYIQLILGLLETNPQLITELRQYLPNVPDPA